MPVLLLMACTGRQDNGGDPIIGTWETSIGGFDVLVMVSDSHIQVDHHPAVTYRLNGNELIVDGDVVSRRMVVFPSRHEMVQTDPLSGTEQHYRRMP